MNVCRVQCFPSFPLFVKWCGRIIETACELVCMRTIYQSCFRAFSSIFLIWTADMTTFIITDDSRFSMAQSVTEWSVGSVQKFAMLLFCLCNDLIIIIIIHGSYMALFSTRDSWFTCDLRWNRDQVDNPESIWTPCWNFELICCLCTEKTPLTYAHTHTHTHTHRLQPVSKLSPWKTFCYHGNQNPP